MPIVIHMQDGHVGIVFIIGHDLFVIVDLFVTVAETYEKHQEQCQFDCGHFFYLVGLN